MFSSCRTTGTQDLFSPFCSVTPFFKFPRLFVCESFPCSKYRTSIQFEDAAADPSIEVDASDVVEVSKLPSSAGRLGSKTLSFLEPEPKRGL